MTNHTERLDRELQEITQPLVDHLHEVEAEIERGKQELAELTRVRVQLTAIVRRIDPELAPVTQKNGGTKQKGVSKDRLERLTAFLHEHREELNGNGGFTAGDLYDTGKIEHIIKARSGVSIALNVLHDQGITRLDHVAKNNARHFKVVT